MRRILILLAAFAVLLAACGGDDLEPAAEGGDDEGEEATATVAVTTSDLGEVLVDGDGETLYMFVPDQEEGEPTCYEDCAEAWPPLEASGDLTAGEGADDGLLGTAERTDGTTQVTYAGLPLYHFSGDEAAGDTNGQGLNEVWWVLSAAGEPIQDGPKDADDDSYGKG